MTPYQPNLARQKIPGGYSERRLSPDSFEVSFAGTRPTSPEVVERYLLYRAAELTLQSGFDWFMVGDHWVERDAYTYISPNSSFSIRYGAGYGEWRTYWRLFRYRLGAGKIAGDPLWWQKTNPRDVRRIEARSVIRMRGGPFPAGEPRGFDARKVIADLTPLIRVPTSVP
nr:hypothetical protein [Allosphingosinicella vermicomposti]